MKSDTGSPRPDLSTSPPARGGGGERGADLTSKKRLCGRETRKRMVG